MDTFASVPVVIGVKPKPVKPVTVTVRESGQDSIRLRVYGYTARQVADALKKALV